MSDHQITPEQQKEILAHLYRHETRNDSQANLERLKQKYPHLAHQYGLQTMETNEVGRIFKQTGFHSMEVEEAIKKATGHDIDLESL